MTITEMRGLLARAGRRWSQNNASRMAAAMAFYAIMAFAPMLLFFVTFGGEFLNIGALKETILHQARTQLGQSTAGLIQSMLESPRKPGQNAFTGVITIILALLGSSGLFDQLNLSVNQIWGVGPKAGNVIRQFVLSKLLSVLMVLVFVTMIFLWIGVDSVVTYLRHETGRQYPVWREVSFIVSVAFLTGVFALTFRAFPRGKVHWANVWFPAFLTALGFGVAKYLLSLYFGISTIGTTYGPAGAVVVILLWFYYSAQIFFYGIELTYAMAHPEGETDDA